MNCGLPGRWAAIAGTPREVSGAERARAIGTSYGRAAEPGTVPVKTGNSRARPYLAADRGPGIGAPLAFILSSECAT